MAVAPCSSCCVDARRKRCSMEPRVGKGAWAARDPPRLVAELALRHHQMVLLVMRSLHHDPQEAERLELDRLRGIAAGDGELDAFGKVFGLGGPAKLV